MEGEFKSLVCNLDDVIIHVLFTLKGLILRRRRRKCFYFYSQTTNWNVSSAFDPSIVSEHAHTNTTEGCQLMEPVEQLGGLGALIEGTSALFLHYPYQTSLFGGRALTERNVYVTHSLPVYYQSPTLSLPGVGGSRDVWGGGGRRHPGGEGSLCPGDSQEACGRILPWWPPDGLHGPGPEDPAHHRCDQRAARGQT